MTTNVGLQMRRQSLFLEQCLVMLLGKAIFPLDLVQMGYVKFYCNNGKERHRLNIEHVGYE